MAVEKHRTRELIGYRVSIKVGWIATTGEVHYRWVARHPDRRTRRGQWTSFKDAVDRAVAMGAEPIYLPADVQEALRQ